MCFCVGTTSTVVNPDRSGGENDDDNINKAVLIGVLVPVLFVFILVITAIMMYTVKRSRLAFFVSNHLYV